MLPDSAGPRTVGTPGYPADLIEADEETMAEVAGFRNGVPIHMDRLNHRHVLTGSGPVPTMMSMTAQNLPYAVGITELDLARPYCGMTHWNSLYWTNFPPLYIFGSAMVEFEDSDFYRALHTLNSDGRLSEQWVSFEAARQDLCLNTPMPKGSKKLKVEVMQYEGQRDVAWKFPLQSYMPKRDNHRPYEVQARRFWDNTVINLGINAVDFSEKVKPVGDIDCYIHINDLNGNPTWGYWHCLMRIGGWPFRISRIGSFEGHPNGAGLSFSASIHHYDEQCIWSLLEGGPEMVSNGQGEMVLRDASALKGKKLWAMLYELDWPGPKRDESKAYDPEIPVEKGYVWFTVEESCREPQTGKKAVKIRLLDEGIVPCWMDLKYLQVWCGDEPLGCFNEAESDEPPASKIKVHRILDGTMDATGKPNSSRRIVTENTYSKIVFKDPHDQDHYDTVDMGWAIKDCCYQGCTISVGSRAGAWAEEDAIGKDEGKVHEKSIRLPILNKGEVIDPPTKNDRWATAPNHGA